MKEFQVDKNNFQKGNIVDTLSLSDAVLEASEILVKIDRFAYTSNNITYAVTGHMLGYWKFFPAFENEENKGVIPVWGFADIIRSENEQLPIGERLFGYFPSASHLKLQPVKISDQRFIDGSLHRAELPLGYNIYRRVEAEQGYSRVMDNARMLLFPLHLTAFCLWDLLKEKEWYGAEQIIILSASSKTSLGLAYALYIDDSAPSVIGLTSPRNITSVATTNLYHEILPYENLNTIDPNIPTMIIDMSGNVEVLKSLFMHLGENRTYCINVGITHWEEAGKKEAMLSERSEFFFAPSQIQKLIKDWGSEGFERKSGAFLKASTTEITKWLQFEMINGLEGLAEIHRDVCEGKIEANKGLIVEMGN